MGHIRLGVLPKTHKWKTVIGYLGDPDILVAEVAEKVLDSAQEILATESSKSSVSYCIWLLSQLTLSARNDDFPGSLASIGIQVTDQTNATQFLVKTSNIATHHLARLHPYTALNNIAGLALRETLTRSVGVYGNTLFGSALADIQSALKRYSTNKQFGELLHIYFTAFLNRTLRFIVDKEIANHLGPGQRFRDIQELADFEQALELFAGQTTRIVDEFSGGWYSKQVWQAGDISEEDATRFVYVALKKLRADLNLSEVQE